MTKRNKAYWINKCKEQVEYTTKLERQIRVLQQELSAAYENRVTICKQLAEQKSEIKRLTEENKKLTETHRVMEHNLDFHRNKKFELQKQVDELQQKINFEHELGDIKVAQALADFEEWKKQAVKEILQTIMNIIKKSDSFLSEEVVRILAKQNGVEVE